jgi:hypothetical protein
MMSIKKAISIFFALAFITSLPACSRTSEAPSATETIGVWRLTLIETLITDDLQTELSSVQYSGESLQSQINETPNLGMVFVLVQLIVEKEQTGAAVFFWDRLLIEDAQGNTYMRLENDTFLESYGFKRQRSTDLTLGKNEGYLCYELPLDAISGKLTLRYESDDSVCSIPIQ